MPPGFKPSTAGDIGWGVLGDGGEALPERTVERPALHRLRLLRRHHYPNRRRRPSASWRRTSRALLIYRSPSSACASCWISYVCLRPTVASPEPAQLPRGHRPGDFPREHRRHVYGVEFTRVPESFTHERAMSRHPARRRSLACAALPARGASALCGPSSSTPCATTGAKVTAVHKANVLRATCGLFLEVAREVAARYPQIDSTTPTWIHGHVAAKNPFSYDVIVTTNCSATSSPTCARKWSAAWASPTAATSATATRSSSLPHGSRPSTPAGTR